MKTLRVLLSVGVIAIAPPLAPRLMMYDRFGTFSEVVLWMTSLIAKACPSSSEYSDGSAPGVSTKTTTGQPRCSARSMK